MTDISPLFISGVYRSGTTLPVKILNAHPELSITHDSINFFRFYLRYSGALEKYRNFIIDDCAKRLGDRFGIQVPVEEVLADTSDAKSLSFSSLYDSIMRHTFITDEKTKRWGEKSLMQWTSIPLFLQMFPDSQAIMIVRDPRSVLASFRDFTIEKDQRYLDAVFACLHSMNWAASTAKALDPTRFKLVYYEEIVDSPDNWAREMCQFLGIEFHPDMVDQKKFKDHTGKPWQPNTSYNDVGNSISGKPTERWRQKLSKVELCFAESLLGDVMNAHGYEKTDVKINSEELNDLFNTVGNNDLLQHRLANWYETGNGVESHPSDPTNPKNWSKTMLPKDTVK